MKTIVSLKVASDSPADGIDNFNRAVFGRMDASKVAFYAAGAVENKGAMKKIDGSVARAIRAMKPDILWGNGNTKELGIALAKPNGARYIINFHTILVKKTSADGAWKVRTPWFVRKLLFDRADLIICPSEFSAETVRRHLPKLRVESILNGVDLERFNPAKKNTAYLAKEYGMDFSKPVIAFLGALQARKRPDVFIKVAERCPEANFIAVGREFSPDDFITASKSVKNFQWVPKLPPRDDSGVFLASSTAFLFPSANEPAAAVILEAMASGAIPILSKSGGNGEFMKEGESGFLVPIDDGEIDAFVSIVRNLLNDPALRERLSRAARAEAERHSWDAVAKQYESMIFS